MSGPQKQLFSVIWVTNVGRGVISCAVNSQVAKPSQAVFLKGGASPIPCWSWSSGKARAGTWVVPSRKEDRGQQTPESLDSEFHPQDSSEMPKQRFRLRCPQGRTVSHLFCGENTTEPLTLSCPQEALPRVDSSQEAALPVRVPYVILNTTICFPFRSQAAALLLPREPSCGSQSSHGTEILKKVVVSDTLFQASQPTLSRRPGHRPA